MPSNEAVLHQILLAFSSMEKLESSAKTRQSLWRTGQKAKTMMVQQHTIFFQPPQHPSKPRTIRGTRVIRHPKLRPMSIPWAETVTLDCECHVLSVFVQLPKLSVTREVAISTWIDRMSVTARMQLMQHNSPRLSHAMTSAHSSSLVFRTRLPTRISPVSSAEAEYLTFTLPPTRRQEFQCARVLQTSCIGSSVMTYTSRPNE